MGSRTLLSQLRIFIRTIQLLQCSLLIVVQCPSRLQKSSQESDPRQLTAIAATTADNRARLASFLPRLSPLMLSGQSQAKILSEGVEQAWPMSFFCSFSFCKCVLCPFATGPRGEWIQFWVNQMKWYNGQAAWKEGGKQASKMGLYKAKKKLKRWACE